MYIHSEYIERCRKPLQASGALIIYSSIKENENLLCHELYGLLQQLLHQRGFCIVQTHSNNTAGLHLTIVYVSIFDSQRHTRNETEQRVTEESHSQIGVKIVIFLNSRKQGWTLFFNKKNYSTYRCAVKTKQTFIKSEISRLKQQETRFHYTSPSIN